MTRETLIYASTILIKTLSTVLMFWFEKHSVNASTILIKTALNKLKCFRETSYCLPPPTNNFMNSSEIQTFAGSRISCPSSDNVVVREKLFKLLWDFVGFLICFQLVFSSDGVASWTWLFLIQKLLFHFTIFYELILRFLKKKLNNCCGCWVTELLS